MAVSSFSAVSTGGNNFYVKLTGSTTTATVASKPAGEYSIASSLSDVTKDVYLFAADGSQAGYSGNTGITATKDFVKIVILGGTTNDFIFFENVPTYGSTQTTSEVTAGPVAISTTPTDLKFTNDTTTITGANFADNVSVSFVGQDAVVRVAKSVIRSNANSLIVTRPDLLPVTASPFSIKISNPGVSDPVGSAVNIISNAITAGSAPVWVTTSPLTSFTKGTAYSTTLSATDADGSITYSIASGSLPTGLSLVGSTGVISGTPTTSASATFTARATDTGGNFVDRVFSLPNPDPVWVTAAGALTDMVIGTAYSYQLQATNDDTLTYTKTSGTFPTGLSMSTSGLISGTPTAGNSNAPFTIRITDPNGAYVERSFTIGASVYVNITSTQSWTAPAGVTSVSAALIAGGGSGAVSSSSYSGGGGGAGGVLLQTLTVSPGTAYTITIGAGGAGVGAYNIGNMGANTTFGALATANGGGFGGSPYNTAWYARAGGSGGGAYPPDGTPGAGTTGQGFAGGSWASNLGGAGGGGGSAGSGTTPGTGKNVSAYNNVGITTIGAGGGTRTSNGSGTVGGANTGDGGGGGGFGGWDGGAGGSGRVLIRYVL